MARWLGVPQQTDSSKGIAVPRVVEKHACPVGPEDRTGGGQILLSGPLRWRVKAILKDSRDPAPQRQIVFF